MQAKELGATFGLKVEEIAEVLCMSKPTLYRLLSGEGNPSPNKINFYEKQLKLTSNEETQKDIKTALKKAEEREAAIQELLDIYKNKK